MTSSPTVAQLTTPAYWELEGQLRRYGEINPGLCLQFNDAVNMTLDRARTFPLLGFRIHGDVRRRLVQRYPYSVIYRPSGGRIVVFAIAHQARRPGYWVDRVREPPVVAYA